MPKVTPFDFHLKYVTLEPRYVGDVEEVENALDVVIERLPDVTEVTVRRDGPRWLGVATVGGDPLTGPPSLTPSEALRAIVGVLYIEASRRI